MPKVSVLIPSYNHAKFIGEAIQSVLSQRFQDFEIIIKDDGSSDNSLEVIRSFTDPRIRLEVNEYNLWSGTHNDIIRLAKGEYLALLNSDDVWMFDKLEKQVKFLDENPLYGAVFSDAQAISECGNNFNDANHFYHSIFKQPNRTRIEWLKYFFEVGNCICHPSMLIRADVYKDIGLYNQLMGALPDMDMWVRLCSKYDIYIYPEKLIKFRILNGEKNASGNNVPNILRGHYDYGKLFDSFAKLQDIELFNSIFLAHSAQRIEEIPIKLALNLLEDNRIFAQFWAINKIYELLYSDYQCFSKFITAKEFKLLLGRSDIYDVFGARGSVVHLFYDNGSNFNSKQYLQQNVIVGKNSYSFNLNDLSGITRLRFDPINQPAKVKLSSAQVKLANGENYPLELVWHNADLNSDIYDFKHDDPQFVFDIPVAIQADLVSVEIVVDITPYNKWKILGLLSVANYETKLVQNRLDQCEKLAHQLNPWNNAQVCLHYDTGSDFNGTEFLFQPAHDGVNTCEFDLNGIANLKGLRLDPVNLPARVKLLSAQLVANEGTSYDMPIKWHNANNINQDEFGFYHDDPIIIFDLTNLNLTNYSKLSCEFQLSLVNVHELSSFILNQLAQLSEQSIELQNTESKLINVTNELTASNERLNSTQNELTAVYQSQSWKITKPLRKFCKLFKG